MLEHARAKLKREGCDLLVVNAVGEGKAFETEDNAGSLLGRVSEHPIALGSKAHMAHPIYGTPWPRRRGRPRLDDRCMSFDQQLDFRKEWCDTS